MAAHICLSEYTNRGSEGGYKPCHSVSPINFLECSCKNKVPEYQAVTKILNNFLHTPCLR